MHLTIRTIYKYLYSTLKNSIMPARDAIGEGLGTYVALCSMVLLYLEVSRNLPSRHLSERYACSLPQVVYGVNGKGG